MTKLYNLTQYSDIPDEKFSLHISLRYPYHEYPENLISSFLSININIGNAVGTGCSDPDYAVENLIRPYSNKTIKR